MTVKAVIDRFRRKHPENEAEAMIYCGVSLRWLACGAFRDVYQVEDLPLVFKVPREEGSNHARREIRVYRRIMRSDKYINIRHLMPAIHWASSDSGAVLMEKYESLVGNPKMQRALKRQKVAELIGVTVGLGTGGERVWDGWYPNFGYRAADNSLVVVDLGCLERSGEFERDESETEDQSSR